jgi:hypothetical protein
MTGSVAPNFRLRPLREMRSMVGADGDLLRESLLSVSPTGDEADTTTGEKNSEKVAGFGGPNSDKAKTNKKASRGTETDTASSADVNVSTASRATGTGQGVKNNVLPPHQGASRRQSKQSVNGEHGASLRQMKKDEAKATRSRSRGCVLHHHICLPGFAATLH